MRMILTSSLVNVLSCVSMAGDTTVVALLKAYQISIFMTGFARLPGDRMKHRSHLWPHSCCLPAYQNFLAWHSSVFSQNIERWCRCPCWYVIGLWQSRFHIELVVCEIGQVSYIYYWQTDVYILTITWITWYEARSKTKTVMVVWRWCWNANPSICHLPENPHQRTT